MKKKNLATAMAAAMAVTAVAPVVAHADSKVDENNTGVNVKELKKAIEKNINEENVKGYIGNAEVINADVAYNKGVYTQSYREIYNDNNTLETKDDTLKEGIQVLYGVGNVKNDLNGTDAKYIISKENSMKNSNASKIEKVKLESAQEKIKKLKKVCNEEVITFATIDENGNLKNTYKVVVLTDKKDNSVKYEVAFKNVEIKSDIKTEEVKAEGEKLHIKDVLTNNYVELKTISVLNDEMRFFFNIEKDKLGLLEDYNKVMSTLNEAYTGKDIKTKETNIDNKKTIEFIKTTKEGKKVNEERLGTIIISGYTSYLKLAQVKDLSSINEFSWAKKDVVDNIMSGILKGNENHELQLGKEITKAEFAKFLNVIMNIEKAKDFKEVKFKGFADVQDKNAWYYNDVVSLAKKGVISGNEKGNFEPNKAITRQEAAVMIAKALNKGNAVDTLNKKGEQKTTVTRFYDNQSIAAWADASVNALQAGKIANGVPVEGSNQNDFNPTTNIMKVEALTMINRAKTVQSATLENKDAKHEDRMAKFALDKALMLEK